MKYLLILLVFLSSCVEKIEVRKDTTKFCSVIITKWDDSKIIELDNMTTSQIIAYYEIDSKRTEIYCSKKFASK